MYCFQMASSTRLTTSAAKTKLESDACSTASEFVQLFYDRLDTKRHIIGKLYLDTATVAWNGNKIEGEREASTVL